jgi:rRNA-processing protein FCF1
MDGFGLTSAELVDSNFVHAIDQFKMELLPALERTLQGKPKPCTYWHESINYRDPQR